jgi:DNA (cytosine-5)-methyltransferase 1
MVDTIMRAMREQPDEQPTPVCMVSSAANAEHMENCSPTLCARQHKDPPIVVYSDDKTQMVLYAGLYWTVRRLMPVECERLQGFPDGWTEISWRGKPSEECPDGPRYKSLGNSMAVPVMRWIGRRIEATS